MKLHLQILFLLLTWLTTFANATTSCQNIALLNNKSTFSGHASTLAVFDNFNIVGELVAVNGNEFYIKNPHLYNAEIDGDIVGGILDINTIPVLEGDVIVTKSYEAVYTSLNRVLLRVVQGAGNWVTAFPKLASKASAWSHLELVFEGVDDYVRVLSKNGDEVAKVFKNGTDEVFEISDDFFRATPTNPATPITGITVKANTGETIIGGGFFKNADGSIGFVEDVSSYGSTIVQNTIKNRGNLRGTLNGIQATEDAHHIIPVQLLKENDVVKKAVEGGFDFNGATNGLAIEKYSKSTGLGRHGPHPNYTEQIRTYLEEWAELYPNFTPQMAKNELEDIVNLITNKINTSTERINLLNLGL